MKDKRSTEFEHFDSTMRKLVSVSHDELKAKLDAEKKEKNKSPAKSGRPRRKRPPV